MEQPSKLSDMTSQQIKDHVQQRWPGLSVYFSWDGTLTVSIDPDPKVPDIQEVTLLTLYRDERDRWETVLFEVGSRQQVRTIQDVCREIRKCVRTLRGLLVEKRPS